MGGGVHYRFQDFCDGADLRDYSGSNGVTEGVGVQVAEVGESSHSHEKVQSKKKLLWVLKRRRTFLRCGFLFSYRAIVNTGEAIASNATLKLYFHFGM